MNRTSLIYGRVSSLESDHRQSTDRQTYSLTNLIKSNGDILVHEPFTEYISGAKTNSERLVFMECLNYAKDNNVDIIYFSSVDRMGRAIWQVLESIKFCLDNHINCYWLTHTCIKRIFLQQHNWCVDNFRRNNQWRYHHYYVCDRKSIQCNSSWNKCNNKL